MKVVKLYHKYEKSHLFKAADWISQTNNKRLELFHEDHPNIESSNLKVLANYPPKSWAVNPDKRIRHTFPLKFVYVGSLSLQDTYIKEFCDWVNSQEGNALLDIYAYNLHEDTVQYLSNLNSSYITFFRDGIEYDNIPAILLGYDIGLILYKAKTDNYKFNASNKLFEYLALNLCVMYSDKMLGVKPYDSGLVQSFNFSDLPDLNDVTNRFNFELRKKEEYFAENEYDKLYLAMIKD
ncbi:glycosyltransferase family protein [Winogradskyella aurantiaca]|uniref:hypothetical protein n=1 Tax=Winogradskyella aurantiaca TaxID=2219558 RepID=UPI0013001A87|nr:hypothetical protein [Winogradskyella aurantiaca]